MSECLKCGEPDDTFCSCGRKDEVAYVEHITTFSPCRKYRYELWREWGGCDLFEGDGINRSNSFVMFIGLNPSTADETNDDPTIRRCIQFAKDWGYPALCMTNLFAFRTKDPAVMKVARDPIGPDNDSALKRLASTAGIVIAAWGKDGKHLERANAVRKMLPKLHCLKLNNDGSPAHPLYLRADLKPIPL